MPTEGAEVMMSDQGQQFTRALLYEVMRHTHTYYRNNHDVQRRRPNRVAALRQQVNDLFYSILRGLKLSRQHFDPATASHHLYEILIQAEAYGHSYALLADDRSRQLFVNLLAYQALGPGHVRLLTTNRAYWHKRQTIDTRYRVDEDAPVQQGSFDLHRFRVPFGDQTLDFFATRMNIMNVFEIGQYQYQHSAPPICVQPGDVVLDLGGCWGDTTLAFAQQAGADGRVFVFEFEADNLRILNRNLDLNPALKPRVTVVEKAASATSDQVMQFVSRGPSTRMDQAGTGGDRAFSVETLSIDDLVARHGLDRVDFIKMDIEGGELAALQGAEQTIRRFRPVLAISAYHKADDFISLPAFIEGLGLGYRFYLDHFTIHREETVLYARVEAAK